MWILRLNMTNRSYKLEELPEKYKYLAGRGLTSTLIHDEIPPTCHALGPNNKLVFSPGFVTGTAAPTSARISVGAKSPLTGTIKEPNAGSEWPQALAVMHIRALVVEGKPEDKNKFWTAHLTWDETAGAPKVEFSPADDYLGMTCQAAFDKVYEKFGKVTVTGIGASGELLYTNSGLVFDDLSHRATRYAGRGGLGAVMGSKGLKFLVINREGAPGVEIADADLLEEGRKKLTQALSTHDITKPKGGLNTYGTAVLINVMNEAGGLPTRNFTSGRFDGAPNIAGEAIFEGNKERLGKELYNHACSPGCIIQCSNTWHKRDGTEHVSCVEYESSWALGADCGIDDLDDVAELIRLCNEYGFDTIEAGTTIAVAMEAGLAEFGDGKKAIELVHEMGKGTPLGRILGNGTDTSTMGADHTAGYTIAPEILSVGGKSDPLSPEGKAELSRAFQATTAFIDSTGHCLFIAFAILDIESGFQGVMDEVNGVLGTQYTMEDAAKLGAEILRKERAFNEAAGFTKVHDRLPEFMMHEKLPPHDNIYDVPDEALDKVYGEM
jgi:aldehyde:ferredoxin oxidoreductase